jgi:hypothetical protein
MYLLGPKAHLYRDVVQLDFATLVPLYLLFTGSTALAKSVRGVRPPVSNAREYGPQLRYRAGPVIHLASSQD